MNDFANKYKNLFSKFGRIFSFVDFGNVNYWYRYDRRDANGIMLPESSFLIVDVQKLALFTRVFSIQQRFYYGLDIRQKSTWHITKLAEINGFRVIKKPIQWVKHYAVSSAAPSDGKQLPKKLFVELPKCNFDVELTVDALRLSGYYDTFVIFSGDSDFAALTRHLRNNGKKVVIFYAGNISHRLREQADLLINAQEIKREITRIKIAAKNKKEPHQK